MCSPLWLQAQKEADAAAKKQVCTACEIDLFIHDNYIHESFNGLLRQFTLSASSASQYMQALDRIAADKAQRKAQANGTAQEEPEQVLHEMEEAGAQ